MKRKNKTTLRHGKQGQSGYENTNPLKRIKSGGDAQHWERTASYLQSSLRFRIPTKHGQNKIFPAILQNDITTH
jgi:hypothetical protein